MHIGVISSSLGGMGSKTCPRRPAIATTTTRVISSRGAPAEARSPPAGSLGFLAWYPDVEQNQNKARHPDPPVPATGSIDALGAAFKELVVGVGQRRVRARGAARERVSLPRPAGSVDHDRRERDHAQGELRSADQVDVELLRQRAAFLRPDSLVAVILLTDEDDSSADPLSFDGTGWLFGDDQRVSRGTSACTTSPASPECTSCELVRTCNPTDPACAKLKNDPACAVSGGLLDASEDSLNVRFHEMKRRFGVDPQFPVSRYVDAFTKTKVPRRSSEHERGVYVGEARLHEPALRGTPAERAQRGALQAAARPAHERPSCTLQSSAECRTSSCRRAASPRPSTGPSCSGRTPRTTTRPASTRT